MNTHRYTPDKIVAENLKFSIPLYQRLFTWDKSQIEGLLFDLKNHFDTSNAEAPYYLGMLSCIGDKREGQNIDSYSLIDGQQRFTVMTLMAIVFSRENYDERWNDFLDGGNRLHFIARSMDNDYLKCSIENQTSVEINEKMEMGIKCISDFMKSEKNFPSGGNGDGGAKDIDERKQFARNIYERMSFFFSELPPSYTTQPASLNKYFEAMNAAGKGLEQHEILKVELMQNQDNKEYLTKIWNVISDMDRPVIKKTEKEPDEDYASKYERTIALCRSENFTVALDYCESSYDTEDNEEIGAIVGKQYKFSRTTDNSGNISLITFPEFLKMVLDIHCNLKGSYSFYRNELINLYKMNQIADIQDFYHQLLYYRLLLDYYIIHKEGDESASKYVLLFKDINVTKSLKQYQCMLYASQTPFYNWIKPLLIRLHKEESINSSLLLEWLKEIDNDLHPMPSDFNTMRYDQGIDRYWFWRLDYYLWENSKNIFRNEHEREIVDNYVFRSNRSIEHLHPQHQANNEEWPENDIHSFGNLAMISQSFNSQQSDDPVNVKFARIAEQAKNHTLQSIKLYRMYLDAEESPMRWNKKTKDAHQDEMYKLLEESYKKAEVGE